MSHREEGSKLDFSRICEIPIGNGHIDHRFNNHNNDNTNDNMNNNHDSAIINDKIINNDNQFEIHAHSNSDHTCTPTLKTHANISSTKETSAHTHKAQDPELRRANGHSVVPLSVGADSNSAPAGNGIDNDAARRDGAKYSSTSVREILDMGGDSHVVVNLEEGFSRPLRNLGGRGGSLERRGDQDGDPRLTDDDCESICWWDGVVYCTALLSSFCVGEFVCVRL